MIVPVDADNIVDVGDTIIVTKEDGTSEEVIIDTYDKYLLYRNSPGQISIHRGRPKDLKASDTIFKLSRINESGVVEEETMSMFETPEARLLHYIKDTASTTVESLIDEIRSNVAKNLSVDKASIQVDTIVNPIITLLRNKFNGDLTAEINYKALSRQLKRDLQNLLNNIADKKDVIIHGMIWSVSSYRVKPAEIAMGRRFKKQLGITDDMALADILRVDENGKSQI